MAKQQTLKQFTWRSTDRNGKKIQGEISAVSLPMAKIQLRQQGISPSRIAMKGNSLFRRSQKVSSADVTGFTRQLATVLKAGVPLLQGLNIIQAGLERPGMQQVIVSLKRNIEQGRSLAESMRLQSGRFDTLYCNLVQLGELSGTLDVMLDRLATYKEKTESLRKKVKKALYYPTAIILVALVVTFIMLLFVIPTFEKMFAQFGATLPAYTQAVVNISIFVRKYWWLIFGFFAGMIFGVRYLLKNSPAFIALWDRTVIRLPIIGVIVSKAIVARYARTLATTFAAGVPLVEAIGSVAGAAGNVVYQSAILQVKKSVEVGVALNIAMRDSKIFPPMLNQMVAIGEESGALDDMLAKSASIYEEEVDNAVGALSSLLEPAIMVIIGFLVGSLVIAMYLPIFKIGSAL